MKKVLVIGAGHLVSTELDRFAKAQKFDVVYDTGLMSLSGSEPSGFDAVVAIGGGEACLGRVADSKKPFFLVYSGTFLDGGDRFNAYGEAYKPTCLFSLGSVTCGTSIRTQDLFGHLSDFILDQLYDGDGQPRQ
jgi:hypothetical protein